MEPALDGDTTDPGIVEPVALVLAPETVTVTLEEAEATLLLDAVGCPQGNAWPGARLRLRRTPEQGFWTTVVSLVEGVIALP